MITAHIAELEAPRRLLFRQERLSPEALGEDRLLCETLVSAISPGTELAAYSGAPPLRAEVGYPRLVGYCNVARIIHSTAADPGVGIGDRILTFSSHRSHFAIEAAAVLALIPGSVRSEDAVLAYFFQLGYSALLKADVRLGSSVVVLGIGVLGLATVAMAALAGAQVVAISDHARAREYALALGASACFERAELSKLRDRLGEHRAQVVVSTSNTWEDWGIAMECAGVQGSIAVLGFPGREQSQIPFNPLQSSDFYARQLRILACGMSPESRDLRGFLPFNERDNIARILRWMAEGKLRASALMAGEFGGRELAKAYERLLNRVDAPGTYLLRWSE